jgi:RNA polymerase sigma-70 factor (ECF subfamily)
VLKVWSRPPSLAKDAPEEALVERARESDPEAFRLIFERHAPAVGRFTLDLLRNAHAAEEATQETFFRAHTLLPRLREAVRLKAFLLGIARNVCFEHRRLGPTVDADPGEEVLEAVIPGPDPLSVLMDAELEETFNQALQELKPQRRAALLMLMDHGLSYEEIGETFGWSLPTVKNEIHRARLTLRRSMLPHLTRSAS